MRLLRTHATHRDPREDQLVPRSQRRRKGRRVHISKHPLRIVKVTHQQSPPDLEIARMGGVHPIAVRLQRCACGIERLRGAAQVARGERDLRLGNDAPRACDNLPRTEGTRGTTQQNFRSSKIAKLRHCNPAKRKRRRIVSQRNTLQRAKRITCRERPRRCCDQ